MVGTPVYLLNEAGAYLGTNQTTDTSGKAEFLLSNTAFKFRVDEGGNHYWSPIVDILSGVVNDVEIDISPVTVSLAPIPKVFKQGSPRS